MTDGDEKYWYNLRTGEVEFGMLSPSAGRVGPFDSEEEASHAPQRLEENSRAWAAEEAREDDWGSGAHTGA